MIKTRTHSRCQAFKATLLLALLFAAAPSLAYTTSKTLRDRPTAAFVRAPALQAAVVTSTDRAADPLFYPNDAVSPPAAAVNPALELPRHDEQDIAKAKMLMDTEMVLGRAAMVAAVILFVVEVTTGQSLPDQMASWMP